MKKIILSLVLIILFLQAGSFSANAQIKKEHQGEWSFESPGAPDGYTYGIIEITKDSLKTSFTTSSYKFPSLWVRTTNDSIIYKSIIDGVDVVFSLKIENKSSITGQAVWYDGQTVMILRKKDQ